MLRSAATWRVSRSVLVKISPFTFTRTCSMIFGAGRRPAAEAHDEQAASATRAACRTALAFIAELFSERNIVISDRAARSTTPPTRSNTPPAAPRILLGRPQDLLLRESWRHLAGPRPGGPPRSAPAADLTLAAWRSDVPALAVLAAVRLAAAAAPARPSSAQSSAPPAARASGPAAAAPAPPAEPGRACACGLNFMTTDRPSRSMLSTPSRSAMTRMRP